MIGVVFLAGFITSDQGFFPRQKLDSLKSAIKKTLFSADTKTITESWRIDTGLLNLQVVKVKAPFDDPGAGGALTSVANELVLMNRLGELFLIEDRIPTPLDISTPDNHLNDYLEFASSAKGQSFTHNPENVRFNDILYIPDVDNGILVVSYTNWHPANQCYDTTLARLNLPEGFSSLRDLKVREEDWKIVYSTQPCLPLNHSGRAIEGHVAGGRLANAGNQIVYLASGDYHLDGVYNSSAVAQVSDNDYGKVLKVDIELGQAEHVSVGMRNPQGITIDSAGRIWAVEHGPRGGDELNLIETGADFGWPAATLGTRYDRLPWPGAEHGRHSNFIEPVYAWIPSIGVSNLIEIRSFDPSWDGDLLVASMSKQSLFRLRIKNAYVQFAETIVIGERIRYVHQHTSGEIVLWTDSEHLLFLSKDEATPAAEYIDSEIKSMDLTPFHQARLTEAITYCMECHSFDQMGTGAAPTLAGILGRPVASTDYPYYSEALLSYSGKWTTSRLRDFLLEPSETVPGTTMPRPNISEDTVENILVLFEALSKAE